MRRNSLKSGRVGATSGDESHRLAYGECGIGDDTAHGGQFVAAHKHGVESVDGNASGERHYRVAAVDETRFNLVDNLTEKPWLDGKDYDVGVDYGLDVVGRDRYVGKLGPDGFEFG